MKYYYRYGLFWYILNSTFQQTCNYLRGRIMMKKHVALALFAAITLVAASSASAFWNSNDNRGGWDDEYDEWDPRYWMDEMEDFFDDDDDDYYRYGRGGPYGGGPYGGGGGYGPGPYGGGGYGPMPYGGGYGPGPGPYGGGGGGYGPAPYGYAPPAPQAAPAPAAPVVR
jgi:hypothetical protein